MCGGGSPDPIEYTPEMAELAKISVDQYNLSKDYEYLKDDLEDKVDELDTQGAEDYVQGRSNLGTQKAYGAAIENARAGLQSSGVDPSSGRATGLETDMYSKQGDSGSESMTNAAFEKDTQALVGKQNVINTGMGKAGTAQLGLSDIASQSVDEAIGDAFSSFNEQAANSQAVGMVMGTGAGLATTINSNSQNKNV